LPRPNPIWLQTEEIKAKRLKRLRERAERLHIDKEKQIKTAIQKRGVVSRKELSELTGFSLDYLSMKLNELVLRGEIKRFALILGAKRGSAKRGAVELFDGLAKLPSYPRNYYYIDDNKAAKLIITKLKLSQNLNPRKKQRLTLFLRRCLPPTLFRKVYKSYSKQPWLLGIK